MTPTINTNEGKNFSCKDTETSREGSEWIFHVNIRSLSKNFDNLDLNLETFSNFKLSVVCLSEAWISNVNELQMLHLNNYLPLIFNPGFNRNNGVVVYVHESIKYEVVFTTANLF